MQIIKKNINKHKMIMSKLFRTCNIKKVISVTELLVMLDRHPPLEFAKYFKVIGFDITVARVELMKAELTLQRN
jgi:hypothetical protein